MKKRRIGIAVATVTLSAGLAGWFAMDKIWPSSPHLFRMAVQEAEAGNFRDAVELIGRASSARGHVKCEERSKTFAHAIPAWQATAAAWEVAQEELGNRQWLSAREALSQTVRWDWNTDTAPLHQRRAEHSARLVNAFLDMCDELAESRSREKLENARKAWTDALALAKAEPAMADEVWTNSFNAVFSQGAILATVEADSMHRNVWMPLRDAGTAIADEIGISLAEYDALQACLEKLAAPDIRILAHPAEACREKIGELYEAARKRKEARVADQAEKKYRVLRYSPLLENQCTRVWEALDDLSAAEGTVARNLETLAALEPGWERHLETELVFPTHTDEASLRAYQDTLKRANARLCTEVVPCLKNIHLAALAEMGMTSPDRVPESIARVTKPETMEEVLRFVDWTERPRRWAAGTVLEGCAYDEILGCEYVIDFLNAYDNAETSFENWSPENLGADGRPCPVARRAREELLVLERFRKYVEKRSLLKGLSEWNPPAGKSNRLQELYKRAGVVKEEVKDAAAEAAGAARKLSGRDAVAMQVFALTLETDPWQEEAVARHKAAYDAYQELFRKYIGAARSESNGDKTYLKECLPDVWWFLEWAEYGKSHVRGRTP